MAKTALLSLSPMAFLSGRSKIARKKQPGRFTGQTFAKPADVAETFARLRARNSWRTSGYLGPTSAHKFARLTSTRQACRRPLLNAVAFLTSPLHLNDVHWLPWVLPPTLALLSLLRQVKKANIRRLAPRSSCKFGPEAHMLMGMHSSL